jgi:hypothetical protein
MWRHVIILDTSLDVDHDLKSLNQSLVTRVLETATTHILTQLHRILREQTFQDPSIDSSFCRPILSLIIISFLVSTYNVLPSLLIVTSSPVRAGTPLPLLLCCISGMGQKGLLQDFAQEGHHPQLSCVAQ